MIYAVIKTVCFNWLPRTFTGSSHWEVFLEVSLIQKTLEFYTSWVQWKNQCRLTLKKHFLFSSIFKHEYQHSTDILVKNIFNPFPGLFWSFSILSEIDQKTRGFLMFQGALKKSNPIEWVKESFHIQLLILLLI